MINFFKSYFKSRYSNDITNSANATTMAGPQPFQITTSSKKQIKIFSQKELTAPQTPFCNISKTIPPLNHNSSKLGAEGWSMCSMDDLLFVGRHDGSVDVYRIDTTEKIFYEFNVLVHEKKSHIRDMKINRIIDGNDKNKRCKDILITCSSDYTIRLSELPKFKHVKTEESNSNSAFEIALLPENHFVTCHYNGNLHFYNKDMEIVKDLPVHSSSCRSVDVLTINHQTYVVSGAWDRCIFITKFSTDSSKGIGVLRKLGYHQSLVNCVRVVGSSLVSTSADEIKIWDPQLWKETRTIRDKGNSIYTLAKLTPRKFIVGGSKKDLTVYDTLLDEVIHRTDVCHSTTIRSCQFIREKNLIVTGAVEYNWWFYRDDFDRMIKDRNSRFEFLKDEICMEDENEMMIEKLVYFVCEKKVESVELASSIYCVLFGIFEFIDMKLLFQIYDYFEDCLFLIHKKKSTNSNNLEKILKSCKSYCLFLLSKIFDKENLVDLFFEGFFSKEDSVSKVIENKKFSNDFVFEAFSQIQKANNFETLKKQVIHKNEEFEQLFLVEDLKFGVSSNNYNFEDISELVKNELFEKKEKIFNQKLSSNQMKNDEEKFLKVHREFLISQSNFFYLTHKNFWSNFPSEISIIELLDFDSIKNFIEFFYLNKIKNLNKSLKFVELFILSIQFFEFNLRDYLIINLSQAFEEKDLDLLKKQIKECSKKVLTEIPKKYQHYFFDLWEKRLGNDILKKIIK